MTEGRDGMAPKAGLMGLTQNRVLLTVDSRDCGTRPGGMVPRRLRLSITQKKCGWPKPPARSGKSELKGVAGSRHPG